MFINGIDQYLQGVLNAKVSATSGGSTVYTLYTAPSASLFNVSIVSSIIACNKDESSARTLSLYLVDTSSTVFSLYFLKSIATTTTVELLTRDLVLKAGEILRLQVSGGTVEVVASIQEFTKVKN
jgi:sensor histidine kinase YesM